jgi:hypothetical protein
LVSLVRSNVLLIISVLLAIYSIGLEFSTRRYLKVFSDPIIPVVGSSEEKIEAMLNWVPHGPARRHGDLTRGLRQRRGIVRSVSGEKIPQAGRKNYHRKAIHEHLRRIPK